LVAAVVSTSEVPAGGGSGRHCGVTASEVANDLDLHERIGLGGVAAGEHGRVGPGEGAVGAG